MSARHGWFLAEFSYASWTECICGYRPENQNEMDNHYPTNEEQGNG